MAYEPRISAVVDLLSRDLVSDAGAHPSAQHVADVVDRVAAELVDAPVQAFVPLLVENRARNILGAEGVHGHAADAADTTATVLSRRSRRIAREHSLLSLG